MGTLYVVATPIGNLGDFSPRAVEVLKNCDLILVEDTRQTIKLLNYFSIKTKMVSYHKFNESKRSKEIIEKLKDGLNIALVSDAGTPCVSDPGYIMVRDARIEGINVLGVPGCSASITALQVSGLDSSTFSFYGFVPTINKERTKLFNDIRESNINVKILYESPKRIFKLLEDLKKEFPGALVCVCTELTKMHEKSFYGPIEIVYETLKNDKNAEKGEYVVLIQNEKISKTKENPCLEAMIIDAMIKNEFSLKDAISYVNKNNDNISKKDIYNASLNLKELLKK